VDGKRFLHTARFLQNNGSDEAAYRTAISRAYYACFLEARRIAFSNCSVAMRTKDGITNEKDIRHKSLQYYLKNSPDKPVRQLGEDLSDLQAIRIDADYIMALAVRAEHAQDAIEDAGAFLAELEKVGPGRVGKAMEEYIARMYPLGSFLHSQYSASQLGISNYSQQAQECRAPKSR